MCERVVKINTNFIDVRSDRKDFGTLLLICMVRVTD